MGGAQVLDATMRLGAAGAISDRGKGEGRVRNGGRDRGGHGSLRTASGRVRGVARWFSQTPGGLTEGEGR